MSWFSDARFGMFVHWGLYSVAGGRWDGMETPWVSEWMMRKFRIPRNEYAGLAAKFTAENFCAERWVAAALEAGMKYMVITGKHHDGFAMFHSRYDNYNITDATPFRRDPLEELAEAARKHGLKLGFYYSHEQDWNEPGAEGNTWDFSPESKSDAAFEEYLNTKVRHQVRELLTNYGDVAIIWFDTPHRISAKQSAELHDFVKKLAPGCLINSRLGGDGSWDYLSLGDNQPPDRRFDTPAEGIGTMNESWGYKPSDHGYRTREEILGILARLSSCGANYMLNVGPDGSGAFPPEAERLLAGIGEFLKVNGEALYGSSPAPVYYPDNRWGYVTAKRDCLYFWCLRHPGTLHFFGIRNKVLSASLLSGEEIPFTQIDRPERDYQQLILAVPPQYAPPMVIRVQCDGIIDGNPSIYHAGE